MTIDQAPIAKVLGWDYELSNAVDGLGQPHDAATMLLGEIDGYPRRRHWSGTAIEYARRFLEFDGGSAYIDSSHLEMNLPEHVDARQHAALLHASLRRVRQAQLAAEERHACKLHVIANCSDRDKSWGSHLNVCLRQTAFEDLFERKPHLSGFLAAHFVTSILYTGQGMVGAANQKPACGFQLSQRGDWFEQFAGYETMFARPLLNQRAEHHARKGLARLHIIFFDLALSPVANLLKAGTMQLVLAMIEAGWADPQLQLDDPLDAVSGISRDLALRQPFRMAGRGRAWRAVEIQKAFAELAGEFVDAGLADRAVPGAREIVAAWLDIIRLLEERALDELARKTDCWLKYLLIGRFLRRRSLSWDAAEARALDLMFGSLAEDGLFFQMAEAGQVEGLPGEAEIQRYLHEPPDETRAYLRAHVLRRFGDHVADMDWDHIRFRVPHGGRWFSEARLEMPDPRAQGRAQCEALLRTAETLDDLLDGLTQDDDLPSSQALTLQEENHHGTRTVSGHS